jgi:hypothetical protein
MKKILVCLTMVFICLSFASFAIQASDLESELSRKEGNVLIMPGGVYQSGSVTGVASRAQLPGLLTFEFYNWTDVVNLDENGDPLMDTWRTWMVILSSVRVHLESEGQEPIAFSPEIITMDTAEYETSISSHVDEKVCSFSVFLPKAEWSYRISADMRQWTLGGVVEEIVNGRSSGSVLLSEFKTELIGFYPYIITPREEIKAPFPFTSTTKTTTTTIRPEFKRL